LAQEEAEEHRHHAGDREDPPLLGLAAIHRHRDRRAGLGVVVPDATAPRVVATLVGLFLAKRLIVTPRHSGAAVADRDQDDTDHPEGRVRDPHQPVPPSVVAASRVRTASWTTAAFAWPRVAFITWPTKKPRTGLPAR